MLQTYANTNLPPLFQEQFDAIKPNGVSTIDFHITAKCSQACPYCWGPRRFRTPVDTETAQRIADYLNFGPFLEVKDLEQDLNASQFDSAKHLRHSRGWGKGSIPVGQTLNAIRTESLNILNA